MFNKHLRVASASTNDVDLFTIFVGLSQSFVDGVCPKTWFSRFINISVEVGRGNVKGLTLDPKA